MNYYYKFLISFLMFLTVQTSNVFADKEEKRPLTLAERIAVGACVGAGEVAFPGQILTYAMNRAIKHEPFVWRHAYNGFFANALGQAPITAIQMGAQTGLSQTLESLQGKKLSNFQNAGVSYAAGVCGALVDTASNAVQLYQQEAKNAGKTIRQALKELGGKSFRGFLPNAVMKEAPFTVGYQMLAPACTQVVQNHVDNKLVATGLGGSFAGAVTALITQPGAVIRNKMQAELFHGKQYSTMGQTIQTICKQEGFKGFFVGLKQRGARVMFAVPLYVAYTNILEKQMKK